MEPLTLTYRETWTALGISEATFYRLLKRGIFDHLRAPLDRKFSKLKVEQWINGRPVQPWRVAS